MEMQSTKLESLEKMSSLNNSIKIYVPSTIGDKKVYNVSFVKRVEGFLTDLFSGCTSYETFGNWYSNEQGKTIRESVTVVQSFAHVLDNNLIDKVVDICEYLKREMQQECISLEVNGKLYFI